MYAVYILFHYKFNEFSIDKQGSRFIENLCYANNFIIDIEFYFDSNDHNPTSSKILFNLLNYVLKGIYVRKGILTRLFRSFSREFGRSICPVE